MKICFGLRVCHEYDTRNRLTLRTDKHRFQLNQYSIYSSGIKLFNDLPTQINILEYLIKKCVVIYSINEFINQAVNR